MGVTCFVAALLSSCHNPLDSDTLAGQSDPLDMASQDSSERPQNNFYLFANGSWIKTTVIPADQRFFLALAQVWKMKTRKERLITLTLTNEHSAPMWRVNGPV